MQETHDEIQGLVNEYADHRFRTYPYTCHTSTAWLAEVLDAMDVVIHVERGKVFWEAAIDGSYMSGERELDTIDDANDIDGKGKEGKGKGRDKLIKEYSNIDELVNERAQAQ